MKKPVTRTTKKAAQKATPAEPDDARIGQRLALLKRQQKAVFAREKFMDFVKFTAPDPEDPNDVERSRYRDAKHHRAIARVLEEVEKGDIQQLILTMPPRHGKLCADDTPILTTEGWRTHGELGVGDFVYGPDGEPTRVVAVSEPGVADHVIEFTNGEVIQCHGAHEWTIYDRTRSKHRTVETRWFSGATRFGAKRSLWSGPKGKRGGRALYQLPHTTAVKGATRLLLIEPYALGVWLGDGSTSKPHVTMAANDAAYVLSAIEASGHASRKSWVHAGTGVPTYSLGGTRPNVLSSFSRGLRTYGVLNRKHIPDAFVTADVEQRLDLLAGLVDTDGHVEQETGRVRFVTGDPRLAEDVYRLCASLGFKPYTTVAQPSVSTSGIVGRREIFTIGFQPTMSLPTKIPRKQCDVRATQRRIGIADVRRAETDKIGRCIQVDRADGLYLVGRSLIPTHNSELTTRRFPAWYIGKNPRDNVVVATYNDTFAEDFGGEVRYIINSPQFKQTFPGVTLRRGSTAKDRLQVHEGGQLSFVGRGGSLTGRGAHCLIIDDLLKDDKEASSQAIRDQAWQWFTKVAMTRRMGKKLVIVIMTRWHSDDIVGRLTDPENPNFNAVESAKWKIINLPAIAEEDDPLGRKPGEALWPDGPDKFDLEFLASQQRLDPLGFSALYQQRPSAADGVLFRREHVRFYDEAPDDLRIYAASDHAVSVAARRDFTCLLVVGVDRQSNIYLLDCWWKRALTDEVTEAMLSIGRMRKPLIWWAERGHISKSIGPFLRKRMVETQTYFALDEVTPVGDKEQRAQSFAARMAMGYVWFPKNAPWVERAINELLGFPNATHDDFVDACSLIGLGLGAQIAAAKPVQKVGPPKYGTLAWARWSEKAQREYELEQEAGGM